jgi:glycosyltransferase involved in cell wall biosynthesis
MNKVTLIPEISIIVPVYKAENYLHGCIESILNQDFSDFELILINDGSPDGSGAICDEFASRDTRVKVIHQSNRGASSARNRGIEAASGRYIGWVDADDVISTDMYSTLYGLMKQYNADIVECQYYEVNNGNVVKSGPDNPVVYGSGDFIMKEFFSSKMKPGLTTKLYKRELWDNVRFPVGRNHQDLYVNMRFALMPLVYARTSEAKYYYIIRNNSITTTRTGREIREAVYKYDYTMDLAGREDMSKMAKKLLMDDAINRFMGRYFEIAVHSNLKYQYVYNHFVRKKLGFSLARYLFRKKLPLRTRISYALVLINLRSMQVFLHKVMGRKKVLSVNEIQSIHIKN